MHAVIRNFRWIKFSFKSLGERKERKFHHKKYTGYTVIDFAYQICERTSYCIDVIHEKLTFQLYHKSNCNKCTINHLEIQL